ncbi:MAG TPA: hypothetical protein VGY30_11310 [Solirubrobacteraceae bacterium]|nr:hypothetical protein [Solirubrobacteraceae bacterium]
MNVLRPLARVLELRVGGHERKLLARASVRAPLWRQANRLAGAVESATATLKTPVNRQVRAVPRCAA